MFTVYTLTSPDGKRYVGCTRQRLKQRFFQHSFAARHQRSRWHLPLYAAMRDVGPRSFAIEALCCVKSRAESRLAERFYIALLNTRWPEGLNLSPSGAGMGRGFGYRHSPASRLKMSASKRGRNHPNFGRRRSKETRKKIAAAQRGPLGNNFGKTASVETREKISAAIRGEKNPMFGKHPWNFGRRKTSH